MGEGCDWCALIGAKPAASDEHRNLAQPHLSPSTLSDHSRTHHRRHVSIPRGQAGHWLLRQDPQHSRPHQAQGVFRERAGATSASLHHPQYHAPATSPRAGTTSIVADALLHTLHTNQEQVYHGRQRSWCFQRLSTWKISIPYECASRKLTRC